MIPALLLIFGMVAYRVAFAVMGDPTVNSWLANFAPFAAIALCGGYFMRGWLAFVIPLLALLVSDVLINMHYQAGFGWEMIPRYGLLAGIAGVGFALARKPNVYLLFGASIGGSLLFHLVTNTVAWLTMPGYAKTFAGWVQSWTLGLAHIQPPAWVFLRNTLVSDLIFTALFVGCMALVTKRNRQPVGASASAHARV